MIEEFVIGFLLGFILRGDWRKILGLLKEWRKSGKKRKKKDAE